MLMGGKVRDKVVALNGRPAVQPTVTLTCCADHRVWDGRAGERFLSSVREILQSDVLAREFSPLTQEKKDSETRRVSAATV
jgi:pyruvate/2-oxoglutarate dehydrogenase complex dihydrolipoamide acyltransferase (E2) component